MAAQYRTTNFYVHAPDAQVARQVRRPGRALPQGEGASLARPGDAELAAAVPSLRDREHGRPERGDIVSLRPGPGPRHENGDPGPARPPAGQRLASRNHAHRLRLLLPPAGAALGRRRRLGPLRGRHRTRPPRPAHPADSQPRPADPDAEAVRAEGVSAAGHVPVRRGLLDVGLPGAGAATTRRSSTSSATACSAAGTSAVQSFYGHRSVEELEEAWLKHLRDTRKRAARQASQPQAPAQVASNNNNPTNAANSRPQGQTTGRPIVRLTAPQAQGFDGQPVFRGQAPDQPNQAGPSADAADAVDEPAGRRRRRRARPVRRAGSRIRAAARWWRPAVSSRAR